MISSAADRRLTRLVLAAWLWGVLRIAVTALFTVLPYLCQTNNYRHDRTSTLRVTNEKSGLPGFSARQCHLLVLADLAQNPA